eukprot:849099-Rhodomonas_salina.1
MSESGIHVRWPSRICWPWLMLNADAMLLMVCQMRSSLNQMPCCRQVKPTLKREIRMPAVCRAE